MTPPLLAGSERNPTGRRMGENAEPPGEGMMLRFEYGAWRGDDETVQIVAITDQALQRHADRYLRAHDGSTLSQALRKVRRSVYWHDYANQTRENDVHVVRKFQGAIDERFNYWRMP